MGLMERLRALGASRREARVLILGLDHSGKSCVLRALAAPEGAQSAPPVATAPTLDEHEEKFHSNGVAWTARDVGGARRQRALWERHFRAADALLYVVDAADPLRLVVAREELWLVLQHPEVASRRAPLLLLANKSELPAALPPAALAAALSLERLTDKPWHVCACSAATGAGLPAGVAWLARQLRET